MNESLSSYVFLPTRADLGRQGDSFHESSRYRVGLIDEAGVLIEEQVIPGVGFVSDYKMNRLRMPKGKRIATFSHGEGGTLLIDPTMALQVIKKAERRAGGSSVEFNGPNTPGRELVTEGVVNQDLLFLAMPGQEITYHMNDGMRVRFWVDGVE